jgi:hypothetical protein
VLIISSRGLSVKIKPADTLSSDTVDGGEAELFFILIPSTKKFSDVYVLIDF